VRAAESRLRYVIEAGRQQEVIDAAQAAYEEVLRAVEIDRERDEERPS
jgi:hypothetical protein